MTETAAPTFGASDDGDMSYSGNAMHDDGAPFDNATFVQEDEPLPPVDDNPYDGFLNADTPEFEPDLSLIDSKPRGAKAKKYEKKVAGLFSVGVKVTIAHPRTLADSAALLMYGPNIAEKAGDLAASNERAAALIDMITDQTENPATALIVASIPLALQVIRNHEPQLETKERGIPVGRGRRIKFRIPFRLGKRMKNVTRPPDVIAHEVFSNEKVQEALARQGINIVVG